jgi:hypothetical protein
MASPITAISRLIWQLFASINMPVRQSLLNSSYEIYSCKCLIFQTHQAKSYLFVETKVDAQKSWKNKYFPCICLFVIVYVSAINSSSHTIVEWHVWCDQIVCQINASISVANSNDVTEKSDVIPLKYESISMHWMNQNDTDDRMYRK